jgi:hypothetical protein
MLHVDDFVNTLDYGGCLSEACTHPLCFDSQGFNDLDFNVDDVLTCIKFKKLKQCVHNCSICSSKCFSNLNSLHSLFGYFLLSSRLISSHQHSSLTINPDVRSYINIQHLYQGLPNLLSKTAIIASHINVNLFQELCRGFHDPQIFDLIKYGFPLDLEKSSFIPNLAVTNHGSATQFPTAVDTYFSEEISLGSIFGPFQDPPFADLHCSPLMTAPKDGTKRRKRRIIVDLSFPSPHNQAVNISVSKNSYVGTPFHLKLPTTDHICQALNMLGKNIKIFKVDLARAFRQLHVDPFDIKYLGLSWRERFYVDVCMPFGYRNGTLACVRVTDAILYILAQHGIFVFNYIDDLIGLAPDSVANTHFNFTLNLLNSLGFVISNSKTVAPTYVATCLGITFNINWVFYLFL